MIVRNKYTRQKLVMAFLMCKSYSKQLQESFTRDSFLPSWEPVEREKLHFSIALIFAPVATWRCPESAASTARQSALIRWPDFPVTCSRTTCSSVRWRYTSNFDSKPCFVWKKACHMLSVWNVSRRSFKRWDLLKALTQWLVTRLEESKESRAARKNGWPSLVR